MLYKTEYLPFTEPPLNVGNSFSYIDFDVTNFSYYLYQLSAVNFYGEGALSNIVKTTHPDNIKDIGEIYIRVNKNSDEAPMRVDFDCYGLMDYSDIISFEWDFGDGGKSNNKKSGHTFFRPGNYTVTLKVTDIFEQNVTANITITVYPKNVIEEIENGNDKKIILQYQSNLAIIISMIIIFIIIIYIWYLIRIKKR
jgi:PKD repeat protein